MRLAMLAVLALSCVATSSAEATDCSGWQRLARAEKETKLVSMIDERLEGPSGQKYTSANRARMRDCLLDRLYSIRRDFDENCKASMRRRLEEILKDYIYSCAN